MAAPLSAIVAFALAWTLVRVTRVLAQRRGLLDHPNERSSHVRPTPRLGGLGILGALLVTVAVAHAGWGLVTRDAWVLIGLAAAVSAVSLLDDLRGLSPVVRLAVHLGVAAATVAWFGPLDPGLPVAGVPLAAAHLVTVLWIAGFINAFNFMDGTDGIAAIQAIVGAGAWAMAAWLLDATIAGWLALTVAAATAGFLLHNWSPASIFMGDVGSALLGYLLATLPLLLDPRPPLTVVLLPVWPFVFDTALTLVRRARRGENLLAAHRTHLYQRLTQHGWPHGRTALLYAGLALAGAAVAVPMAGGRWESPLPSILVLAAGSSTLWGLVLSREARWPRRNTMGAMTVGRSDDA